MKEHEYKRVPDDHGRPAIGFYLRCAHCTVINVVLAAENEASDAGGILSVLKPFTCSRCSKQLVVRGGEIFDA